MRLYTDVNIDIRVFIFNGSKLIFCARNPKQFLEEWIKKGVVKVVSVFSGEEWHLTDANDVILLNLLPVNVSVSSSANSFSTATLTFANSYGRFYKRNIGKNVKTYWDTWRGRGLFDDDIDKNEAIDILMENLKKLSEEDYYKKSLHYFREKITGSYDSFSRPYKVVDYGYLIFIDALDRDGEWRSIFSGYVTSVNEQYTSAHDRRIVLNCIGFGNYFERVPIFPELGSGLFSNFIFPKDDPEKAKFLLSYFAQYRQTGDIYKESYMNKDVKELMLFVNEILRRRLGLITEDELFNTVNTLVKGDEEFKNEFKALFGGISEVDMRNCFEVYRKYLKSDTAYKFAFYKQVVDVYKGISNRRKKIEKFYLPPNTLGEKIGTCGIAQIYIPAEFDFKDKGFEYYKMVYGLPRLKKLMDSGIFDSPKTLFEAFQKVIGISIMQTPFHPTNKRLSELFKAFIRIFGLVLWEDGFGNLIIDFPRYNEIPGSRYAFYEDLRGEEGKRYILYEHKDILNYSRSKDGGRLLTAFYFHGRFNIPNVNMPDILNETLSSGHAFHEPQYLLKFGYNVEVLQDVYLNFQIDQKDTDELISALNEYASAFLEARNAFVTKKMNITLRHRPDLQVNRTVYIPSLEKLYLISSVSHNITLGSDFTTTLSLSAGHSIDLRLKEPRVVFIKRLSKFAKNLKPFDQHVDGDYKPSCGIVRIDGRYFPADIKAGVLTTAVRVREDPSVENRKVYKGLSVFESELLGKREYAWVDLDVRLVYFVDWFYTHYTNSVNGKNVLKYKSKTILSDFDVLVIPSISSIWRTPKEEAELTGSMSTSMMTRHASGRAIDINGLTFIIFNTAGLFKTLKWLAKRGWVRIKRERVISPGKVVIDDMYAYDFLGIVEKYKYNLYELVGLIRKPTLINQWVEPYTQEYYDLWTFVNLVNLFLVDERDAIRISTNFKGWKVKKEKLVSVRQEYVPPVVKSYDTIGVPAMEKFRTELEEIPVKEEVEVTSDYLCILKFSFNGEPFDKEAIKVKNKISDWVVADILSSNEEYKGEVGNFVDATRGVLKDKEGGLVRILQRYADGSEDPSEREIWLKLLKEMTKVSISSLPGKEDNATYNFLIWKAGKFKGENVDFTEIEKRIDELYGVVKNSDTLHLRHIHIAVGDPNCALIETLLAGLE